MQGIELVERWKLDSTVSRIGRPIIIGPHKVKSAVMEPTLSPKAAKMTREAKQTSRWVPISQM